MRVVQRTAIPSCLLAILLTASPAGAQIVKGTLTDEVDKTPVATVEVTLADESGAPVGQVLTDSLGVFRILAPLPGSYTLTLSRIGYATRTTPLFELERGETLTLEISLNTEALHLEPLEIVEHRRDRSPALVRFYERAERARRSGFGRVYYREDIQGFGSVYGLYQMTAIRPTCPMLVLVNDLPIDSPQELEFLAEMERVEGVEIYRDSQIPPEYAYHRACSMMLVWTSAPEGRPFSLVRLFVAVGAIASLLFLIRRD